MFVGMVAAASRSRPSGAAAGHLSDSTEVRTHRGSVRRGPQGLELPPDAGQLTSRWERSAAHSGDHRSASLRTWNARTT